MTRGGFDASELGGADEQSRQAQAPAVPLQASAAEIRRGEETVIVPPLEADPLLQDAVTEAVMGPAPTPTIDQLVRTIGADPHDFAGLYIRNRFSFEMHARRFLNNPHDVEDVLQEAFLRLFLALPELETELQAIAYVRRTITNLCIDRYRSTARRPKLLDLDELVFEVPDDADPDPIVAAEDAAVVREALALLSPLHREALIKREIEEKPLPVIAAELGIEEKNVKHVLLRARRALRRLLVGSSVDPAGLADMSGAEVFSLAARRLGEKPAKIAMVLIMLIAGIAGFTRLPVFDSDGGRVVAGDLPAGPAIRNPNPGPSVTITIPPTTAPTTSPSTAASSGPTTAPSAAGQTPPGAPTISTNGSTHKPGRKPAPKPTQAGGKPSTPPMAPATMPKKRSYKLTGAMTPVTAPDVASSIIKQSEPGAMVEQATHNFEAQTNYGPLAVDQTVSFDGAAIQIEATPKMVVQGQTVQPTVKSARVSKQQVGNAEGIAVRIDMSFDGAEALGPSSSRGLPAIPDQMSIDMVLTPTLDDVWTETVNVDKPTLPATLLRAPAPVTPSPASSPSTDSSAALEPRQAPVGLVREDWAV